MRDTIEGLCDASLFAIHCSLFFFFCPFFFYYSLTNWAYPAAFGLDPVRGGGGGGGGVGLVWWWVRPQLECPDWQKEGNRDGTSQTCGLSVLSVPSPAGPVVIRSKKRVVVVRVVGRCTGDKGFGVVKGGKEGQATVLKVCP